MKQGDRRRSLVLVADNHGMGLMKKLLLVPAAAFAAVSSPALATATGPDFSTLTGAIDFTSAGEAVLAVGALAIGLAVIVLGIRKIMRMVRGA